MPTQRTITVFQFMPTQRTITVFQFSELSDKAKDKARDWFRQFALDPEWWDSVYEDAKTVGLIITEFDIYRGTIKGRLTTDAASCARRIIKEHGPYSDTAKLSREMLPTLYAERSDPDDLAKEFEQQLLERYLIMLRYEKDCLTSNESIDESISANKYEFLEDGSRV